MAKAMPPIGENSPVRQVRKDLHDGPPHQPETHEDEHADAHELAGRIADDHAGDEDDQRESGGDAEHADVAPRERLAAEELGERRGQRIFGVPDEEIEQQPAEEHDADGNRQQGRARLKREAGHLVDRAQAEQQAEQREGDDGGEQRVEKRRPEPLAERCAGLSQGA